MSRPQASGSTSDSAEEIKPAVRSIEECHKIMGQPGLMWEIGSRQRTTAGEEWTERYYKNLPNSLRDFFLFVQTQFADRPYTCFEQLDEAPLSYGQVHQRAIELAVALKERHGIKKGDRVATSCKNMPEWVIAFWATHLLGAVITPINAFLPAPAFTHILKLSRARVLFADAERLEKYSKEISDAKLDLVVGLRAPKASSGVTSFDDVTREFSGAKLERIGKVEIGPDDDASMFCTSGTTGMPKGVLSTQRNFLTNLASSSLAGNRAYIRRGEEIPVPQPGDPQRGILISVPLFHVTGTQSLLMLATASGGKVGLMNRWSPSHALAMIKKFELTNAGGVPSQTMELIREMEKSGPAPSLIGLLFGGAPAARRIPEYARKVAPAAAVSQAWGLTESNSVAISHAAEDYLRRPASTGVATPVCDIRLVDEDGRDVGKGKPGELLIRGPMIAKGYVDEPEKTAESFLPGGWFRSGDIASMDDDGFITILDRSKDIIIFKGENISSVVVENGILGHPDVLEAAAVSLPDPEVGERVGVVATVKEGSKVTEQELIDTARKTLNKHEVPAMILITNSPLARNVNGKPLKPEIAKPIRERWQSKSKL